MEGKRVYYLQYPLGFRQDPDIKRLERKFGVGAPIVFLEINALVADKEFRLRRRPDETFEEQLAIDLDYDGELDLVRDVLNYCLDRKLIVREDTDSDSDGTYYFPWSEKQTMSRSEEAVRKAAYRKQKQMAGGLGTILGQCPDNVPEVSRNVRTDEEDFGTDMGQCPDNVWDKNDNVPQYKGRKEGRKDKEKEIETKYKLNGNEGRKEEDADPSFHPGSWVDGFGGVLFAGGETWVPTDGEYQRLKASFPDINVEAQLEKMRLWADSKGGISSPARPMAAVFNWLSRENINIARIKAQEITKAKYQQQKTRATPEEWADLARRVENGEDFS